MDELISIIVPVYQCEPYLAKCLESIEHQTYPNFEAILVDDGSTDKSGEICKRYAQKDSRFWVIHQQNRGAGAARNKGLANCHGKYIVFVDGDDYIAPNTLATLLNVIKKEKTDIGVSGFYRVYPKAIKKFGPESTAVLSGKEAVIQFFSGSGSTFLSLVCGKIFDRRLFEKDGGIRFPEEKKYEDEFISYKLFYLADKVAFVNHALYYYVAHKESVMHRPVTAEDLRIRGRCILEYYRWMEMTAPDMRQLIEYACIRIFNGLVWSFVEHRELIFLKPMIKQLNRTILANTHDFRRNPYVTTKAYKNYLLMKLGIIIPVKQAARFFKRDKTSSKALE